MARTRTPAKAGDVYITPESESGLQDRLSRIEGHVRGIKKMLGDHQDCDQILTQVAAVKAAISQVAILLLEEHLDTCVADALRSGDGTIAVEGFKDSLSRVLK